ncbi:hypothetical protein FTO74_18140 [Granulicella sp. WH15]|uniref:hypothetical protein n=1 Tax=Granulicella sp. WH15 TaxID=2602070 RepID=UPI00136719AC|nr:hypothetical protein [Granulicella sp. WH15]QHN05059.1 hypothetical protein FTO74_18140 [Granulicella sp. WH15]
MKVFLSQRVLLLSGLLLLPLAAQETPDAKAIIARAVQTELDANHNDHTAFAYRDHDVTPEHDTVYQVVETPKGTLRRKILDHGQPLPPEQQHVEDLRIHAFVHDTSLQQREAKDDVHDQEQAENLLRLLPTAFLWTVRSETPTQVTLDFKPDPEFHAPSMEAKVLSAMEGEVVVAKPSHRIEHLKGTLANDVKLGYGLLGRMKAGGTFTVERREVSPGHWQITGSHVHIVGRALLFKTIGQQEDETKTDFKVSPAETLEKAADVLKETP